MSYSLRRRWLVAALLLGHAGLVVAHEPAHVRLWNGAAPGAHGDAEADIPWITPHLPPSDRATGTAIVICPGGGYGKLAIGYEGHEVAEWLNRMGVAGFVLKYRHRGTGYGHPAPLQDVQRALQHVRAHAEGYGIKPDRIGVLGFSAGGHLASSAATHALAGDPNAPDPMSRVGSRPDFAILIYPVISLVEPLGHMGSARNLLGDNPDAALVESLCNERQVTPDTPPAFLVHGSDDTVVPVENSIAFYQALRRVGVPAELHIFEHGTHGFGLGKPGEATAMWPKLARHWLITRGLLPPANSTSQPSR